MSIKRFSYFIAIICLIASLSCDNKEDPVTVSTADFTTTIDENPTTGASIGTVTGTTNRGSVTFSIASQTPTGAMAIDATTGELTVAENEKRFARLYPCNLPGQRTKEGGRPDDTETQ